MSVEHSTRWAVQLPNGGLIPEVGLQYRRDAEDHLAWSASNAAEIGLADEFAARATIVPLHKITIGLTAGALGDNPTHAELIDAVLSELNSWVPKQEPEPGEPLAEPAGSEATR